MTKFVKKYGIGNRDKLEGCGVHQVYSSDMELVKKSITHPPATIIVESEEDITPLLKSFSAEYGVTIEKAGDQLPLTAMEVENLKMEMANGKQPSEIAKSLNVDVAKVLKLHREGL
tara:strand:+ start:1236 stop:1583 length:348 start_codon:yes stop_codon:yes gene_type:complete